MATNKSPVIRKRLANHHTYEVFTIVTKQSERGERGTLYLYNVQTDELECYTIWEDAHSFLVRLPIGVNGELIEVDVEETFHINPVVFTETREFM